VRLESNASVGRARLLSRIVHCRAGRLTDLIQQRGRLFLGLGKNHSIAQISEVDVLAEFVQIEAGEMLDFRLAVRAPLGHLVEAPRPRVGVENPQCRRLIFPLW
jgi:hypothetical protein